MVDRLAALTMASPAIERWADMHDVCTLMASHDLVDTVRQNCLSSLRLSIPRPWPNPFDLPFILFERMRRLCSHSRHYLYYNHITIDTSLLPFLIAFSVPLLSHRGFLRARHLQPSLSASLHLTPPRYSRVASIRLSHQRAVSSSRQLTGVGQAHSQLTARPLPESLRRTFSQPVRIRRHGSLHRSLPPSVVCFFLFRGAAAAWPRLCSSACRG